MPLSAKARVLVRKTKLKSWKTSKKRSKGVF